MKNEIKTPYFLLREDLLKENVIGFANALHKSWPNSIMAYSVKTNSLPWILNWMNRNDVFAEVVSDEEYQLALLSGYSPERIVFNGPIKSSEYLEKAFLGGSIINIDSQKELDFILTHKPIVNGVLGIRINVDPRIFDPDDVGYQEDGFRFGFSCENGEFQRVIGKINKVYGEIPIGFHLHVNSITRSPRVYKAIANYAARIVIESCIIPAYIDIGGGFFGGVPGKTSPEEYISEIKRELEDVIDISKTTLIIEPGSAFVGSTIELHTSVIDVKDTLFGRIVTTDGSRIHIDPLWQKSGYLYTIDSTQNPYPRQVICGYTCMDHDRIMILENMPELRVGDRIVYHRVGNYTVTFGGAFIKPNPPVYCMAKNRMILIRKEMSMEELYKMETV